MAMTITSASLIDATGSLSNGVKTYKQTWQVKFTGNYSEATLLTTSFAGLPQANEVHPEDSSVYVIAIDVSRDDNTVRIGTTTNPGVANYVVSFGTTATESAGIHPLSRPAEIEWGGSDITETTHVDCEDSPIVNSTGDFYDPLPERFVRGGEVTITRNEEDNPATTCVLYSNAINDASWYGVEAGKVLVGKITARKQTENYAGSDVTYWQVTYPIKLNRNGWRLSLIDNGYRIVVDDKPRGHVDDMGQPSYVPILLDGAGNELPFGNDPVTFPEDGYAMNDAVDLTALALPNPFA